MKKNPLPILPVYQQKNKIRRTLVINQPGKTIPPKAQANIPFNFNFIYLLTF